MLRTDDGRFVYEADGQWRDSQTGKLVPTWIVNAYLSTHREVGLSSEEE